ncbi:PREDICTED: GBF-interacting protein 1-like isoform X2 [Nelumbo nucifera]|uniref:GBF-interacting protein 1-like isoform X2 n=2 Tax=Nelumbo nucifera TaxID=4432 RepID=A0A1U8B883_NELNU|nr:PREDICTED: GBF-interacting protein 1-like isoform X2 [Nelumbo nucifera]DAD33804.1 TPA_asm: hypothetical protein HUJ06_012655 [Nelumbo nucifera]
MSSGASTNTNGKGNNGVPSIPAASRKMVQSLKEIVNYPEHEIYAMLKECNMDPNDTVHRLLSQDPFHEVKSKREKKKEIKVTAEPRSRGVSSTSNRGRGGTDRNVGRGGLTSETGGLRGKPAYKKENGANAFPSSSSSASGMVETTINRRPTSSSDLVAAESKTQTTSTGDGISLASQPSPGYQPAWLGVPGQVSMADIVKMGRPQNKVSTSTPVVTKETSYAQYNAVLPNVSQHTVKHPPFSGNLSEEPHHDLHSSQGAASTFSEVVQKPDAAGSHHVSHDEWSLGDKSVATSGSSVLEPTVDSEAYGDQSDACVDRTSLHLNSRSDDVQVPGEDTTVENISTEQIESISSRNIQEDNSGGTSHFDNTSFQNMGSYQPHRHAFEHEEAEDVTVAVSSAAASLQQLNLQKEELRPSSAEVNPAVIIPDHLQVPTADCSHLSFGSFGSGISASFSGSFASKPLKDNMEEAPLSLDASSVGHSDTRNSEYYGDEHLRSTSDGNLAPRAGAGTGNFDSPSSSQPEVLKPDNAESTHGHQYSFPSSVPGYTFENTAQPNAGLSYAQTNSQMQNLAPFSSVMQAYTSSLPSNLLASNVQPARESDTPYSPFLATQSMPTKYSNTVSSISGPTLSMPEAVKPGIFSTAQPTPQTLPGSSIATGPALPQHLAVHPYSQPTLPLGHFANMIGYPFLPQSYTYMPSAFQQAYAGNSAYHQSPAAVHSAGVKYTLPQYKNSVSVSSLPQSAAVASGYGGFGNSTNIPGNFPLNPSSTPASTTIGYDDVISSQYKDGNQFIPLQQNENSGMWVHGLGSRTMSALPGSTYYSFQGQSQQHGGFRQGQQPSQHYGALGYPNFYQSQTGVSQEHPQQNPNDGTLGGSQGASAKQSHQIWQHNY